MKQRTVLLVLGGRMRVAPGRRGEAEDEWRATAQRPGCVVGKK